MRTNRKVASAPPVFTHEGAPAKKISLELQLRRSVLSCLLWENEFYEDGVAIASRIDSLASQVKPDIVDTLALEARADAKLRHVPLRLVLALVKRKYPDVADTIFNVVQRPDEMGELLSMYWEGGKKVPLANQLKKGLARAFTKFDAYQVAKYRGLDREITLRDVMFMVHPTPADRKMAALYKKLANNELEAPETWEKQASAGTDQKEVFTSLINEKKLGALAMLRNLRNMQQAGVTDATIRKGLEQMNVERVLPFRFITAARYAPQFEAELEEAMFKCLELEDKLLGTTVLAVDISGSMRGGIGGKSELSRVDAACAVAMLLREICEHVKVYSFSDRTVPVANRRGFALAAAIKSSQLMSGTDIGLAVGTANASGPYDRLIVITDEQSRTKVGAPKGRGYMINVASYQNGVGYGEWLRCDGFSESVVEFIQAYEEL